MVEILDWDDPEYWTVDQVADAYHVAAGTVSREWVHWSQWPPAAPQFGKRKAARGRPLKVYPRSGVEDAVTARREATPGAGPAKPLAREWPALERVTLAEIARRLDRGYTEVRNYPRLYPPTSANPFPAAGPDRLRTWGEIAAWYGRRPGMGHHRTPPADEGAPGD
ncbi:hypothetical protein ACFRAO_43890 [Streptomyces sp. NPDC056656]|uniref:hypothetical protein n=1 Tax=Streptomyces sp. NPDC056656 TaxID=3345895 RepID=UPI0036AE924B